MIRQTPVLLCFCLMGEASATFYRCQTAKGIIFQDHTCTQGVSTEIEVKDYQIGTRAVEPPDPSPTKPKRKRKKVHKTHTQDASERTCFSKRQQLERINSKMRHGYTAAQGNRLRERRRQIEEYQRRFCR